MDMEGGGRRIMRQPESYREILFQKKVKKQKNKNQVLYYLIQSSSAKISTF
jgi:hypothetical protein